MKTKQISAHIPFELWQQVIMLKAKGISFRLAIIIGLKKVVAENTE